MAALKHLCYGATFNHDSLYYEMSEDMIRVATELFCQGLIKSPLGKKILRNMSQYDARKVESAHRHEFKVPGCMRDIDCMHCVWENFLVAWQGQFHGKEEIPTMILEALCDINLYIWHAQFGHVGSLNDINVCNVSNLKKSFLDGIFEGDFEYEMGGEIFHNLWMLTDGIYTELARSVIINCIIYYFECNLPNKFYILIDS